MRCVPAAAKRPKTKSDFTHRPAVGSQPWSARASRLVAEYKNINIVRADEAELQEVEKLRAKEKGWVRGTLKLQMGASRPAAGSSKLTGGMMAEDPMEV